MKKWFITLIFVLGCLPVVVVKAAQPQTYMHLDYDVVEGYYDLSSGEYCGEDVNWRCSNKIQLPKNVNRIYISGRYMHFILVFSGETYIGAYYEGDTVLDVISLVGGEEKTLGVYYFMYDDPTLTRDLPANATHIVLQSCHNPTAAGMGDYINPLQTNFSGRVKPLIYYLTPTDAATNMTFGLIPALMIMLVIAGITGGLIMITKKSKR